MDKKERAELIQSLIKHPGWKLVSEWVLRRMEQSKTRLLHTRQDEKNAWYDQGVYSALYELEKTMGEWKKSNGGENLLD